MKDYQNNIAQGMGKNVAIKPGKANVWMRKTFNLMKMIAFFINPLLYGMFIIYYFTMDGGTKK